MHLHARGDIRTLLCIIISSLYYFLVFLLSMAVHPRPVDHAYRSVAFRSSLWRIAFP